MKPTNSDKAWNELTHEELCDECANMDNEIGGLNRRLESLEYRYASLINRLHDAIIGGSD